MTCPMLQSDCDITFAYVIKQILNSHAFVMMLQGYFQRKWLLPFLA